jgi:D-alanine-D-alanine ligase
MPKLQLLLLYGGESTEHDVSIASAQNVYNNLDRDKYDVLLCYIDRQGKWWRASKVEAVVQPNDELIGRFGQPEFISRYDEHLKPDVILPMLHGTGGEDGSVQGLAQLMHVPIVGCGIVGSAICMDKDVAKRLMMQEGIPVVASTVHRRGESQPDYAKLSRQLGETLFVKPANAGSSVGISKATDAASFANAIAEALKYDRKVLIERAIAGREIECSMLGNDDPQASILGEIIPGEEFYSYDDKYAEDTKSQVIVGADLPQEVSDYIRSLAVRAYRALECRGLARVDFFLAENGQVYLNEVNTMPGFNIMYPKLWEASGVSTRELLDRLVQLASSEYTESTKRSV